MDAESPEEDASEAEPPGPKPRKPRATVPGHATPQSLRRNKVLHNFIDRTTPIREASTSTAPGRRARAGCTPHNPRGLAQDERTPSSHAMSNLAPAANPELDAEHAVENDRTSARSLFEMLCLPFTWLRDSFNSFMGCCA
ncbi:unnamed protein product [Peniophora sp. CBMAI 1063]|nr:unnamed protein product [Peniophora sp. CBMAI 1063]